MSIIIWIEFSGILIEVQEFIARNYRVIFTILMVLLVSLAFYAGLLEGRREAGNAVVLSCSEDVLSALKMPTTAFTRESSSVFSADVVSSLPASASSAEPAASSVARKGEFLGSKNGTKYYTPNCGGVSRIKPENIIWFQNEEDARLQGYTPAKC